MKRKLYLILTLLTVPFAAQATNLNLTKNGNQLTFSITDYAPIYGQSFVPISVSFSADKKSEWLRSKIDNIINNQVIECQRTDPRLMISAIKLIDFDSAGSLFNKLNAYTTEERTKIVTVFCSFLASENDKKPIMAIATFCDELPKFHKLDMKSTSDVNSIVRQIAKKSLDELEILNYLPQASDFFLHDIFVNQILAKLNRENLSLLLKNLSHTALQPIKDMAERLGNTMIKEVAEQIQNQLQSGSIAPISRVQFYEQLYANPPDSFINLRNAAKYLNLVTLEKAFVPLQESSLKSTAIISLPTEDLQKKLECELRTSYEELLRMALMARIALSEENSPQEEKVLRKLYNIADRLLQEVNTTGFTLWLVNHNSENTERIGIPMSAKLVRLCKSAQDQYSYSAQELLAPSTSAQELLAPSTSKNFALEYRGSLSGEPETIKKIMNIMLQSVETQKKLVSQVSDKELLKMAYFADYMGNEDFLNVIQNAIMLRTLEKESAQRFFEALKEYSQESDSKLGANLQILFNTSATNLLIPTVMQPKLETLINTANQITCVAELLDGTLAIADTGSGLNFWSTQKPSPAIIALHTTTQEITALATFPDGRVIYAESGNLYADNNTWNFALLNVQMVQPHIINQIIPLSDHELCIVKEVRAAGLTAQAVFNLIILVENPETKIWNISASTDDVAPKYGNRVTVLDKNNIVFINKDEKDLALIYREPNTDSWKGATLAETLQRYKSLGQAYGTWHISGIIALSEKKLALTGDGKVFIVDLLGGATKSWFIYQIFSQGTRDITNNFRLLSRLSDKRFIVGTDGGAMILFDDFGTTPHSQWRPTSLATKLTSSPSLLLALADSKVAAVYKRSNKSLKIMDCSTTGLVRNESDRQLALFLYLMFKCNHVPTDEECDLLGINDLFATASQEFMNHFKEQLQVLGAIEIVPEDDSNNLDAIHAHPAAESSSTNEGNSKCGSKRKLTLKTGLEHIKRVKTMQQIDKKRVTPQLNFQLPQPSSVLALNINKGGAELFTMLSDNQFAITTSIKGQNARRPNFPAKISSSIQLWTKLDNSTWAPYCTLAGHAAHITALTALSPTTMVSGSMEGEVRVWTQNNGKWESSESLSGNNTPTTIYSPVNAIVRLSDNKFVAAIQDTIYILSKQESGSWQPEQKLQTPSKGLITGVRAQENLFAAIHPSPTEQNTTAITVWTKTNKTWNMFACKTFSNGQITAFDLLGNDRIVIGFSTGIVQTLELKTDTTSEQKNTLETVSSLAIDITTNTPIMNLLQIPPIRSGYSIDLGAPSVEALTRTSTPINNITNIKALQNGKILLSTANKRVDLIDLETLVAHKRNGQEVQQNYYKILHESQAQNSSAVAPSNPPLSFTGSTRTEHPTLERNAHSEFLPNGGMVIKTGNELLFLDPETITGDLQASL